MPLLFLFYISFSVTPFYSKTLETAYKNNRGNESIEIKKGKEVKYFDAMDITLLETYSREYLSNERTYLYSKLEITDFERKKSNIKYVKAKEFSRSMSGYFECIDMCRTNYDDCFAIALSGIGSSIQVCRQAFNGCLSYCFLWFLPPSY